MARRFAINFWIWMPATVRACLWAFIAMAAAASSNVGTDVTVIEHWTWSRWLFFALAIGAAGATTLVAFLDQSIQAIKSKASDTMLFFREDPDK